LRSSLFFTLACAVGLGGGVGLSELSLANGGFFGATSIGPWRVSTKAGAVDADPYTRAALERSGEIPIALGEGLQFVARVDDKGSPLRAACSYIVGTHTPAARYWTLSLVDRHGFPVENPARRYGFRSSEILRAGDQSFEIAVSADAHSGNWLPIGAGGNFALVLRLYDSPLSATAAGIEKAAMPNIAIERCA
jgi:hypothetical protein